LALRSDTVFASGFPIDDTKRRKSDVTDGDGCSLEKFGDSVKIVYGKQTETNCCCVAGARPGVYATEVNIQNLNLEPAQRRRTEPLALRSPQH